MQPCTTNSSPHLVAEQTLPLGSSVTGKLWSQLSIWWHLKWFFSLTKIGQPRQPSELRHFTQLCSRGNTAQSLRGG
jgi:hypothetical protein